MRLFFEHLNFAFVENEEEEEEKEDQKENINILKSQVPLWLRAGSLAHLPTLRLDFVLHLGVVDHLAVAHQDGLAHQLMVVHLLGVDWRGFDRQSGQIYVISQRGQIDEGVQRYFSSQTDKQMD